jgi:hypothetical protein
MAPAPAPAPAKAKTDPLIEAIIALLNIKSEVLMPKLDEIEAKEPRLARVVQGMRTFANRLYDGMPLAAMEGFVEVVSLIKKGSGPVSHDPADLA